MRFFIISNQPTLPLEIDYVLIEALVIRHNYHICSDYKIRYPDVNSRFFKLPSWLEVVGHRPLLTSGHRSSQKFKKLNLHNIFLDDIFAMLRSEIITTFAANYNHL